MPGGGPLDDFFLKGKMPDTHISVTGSVTGVAYGVNAFFGGQEGRHYFLIGRGWGNVDMPVIGSILPIDGYALDSKVDDGKPNTGIAGPITTYNDGITDYTCTLNGEYDVTNGSCFLSMAIRSTF